MLKLICFCRTPHPTIRTPPRPPSLALFATVKSMFFKTGVFLVITACWKKKRNVRFLDRCAGVAVCGRLLVVSVPLMLVCSRLWSLPVLVSTV